MIIKTEEVIFNDFIIPRYRLNSGMMIRFWVEIIPRDKNDKDGYFQIKKYQKLLTGKKKEIGIIGGAKLEISNYKIKTSWFEFLKKESIYQYLKASFDLSDREINEKLQYFDLKPEYRLNKLGNSQQKIFSIICGFQKYQNLTYDYFGLSPNLEEQLTKFVKEELKQGKSAISFDNLHFRQNIANNKRIVNLSILRQSRNQTII